MKLSPTTMAATGLALAVGATFAPIARNKMSLETEARSTTEAAGAEADHLASELQRTLQDAGFRIAETIRKEDAAGYMDTVCVDRILDVEGDMPSTYRIRSSRSSENPEGLHSATNGGVVDLYGINSTDLDEHTPGFWPQGLEAPADGYSYTVANATSWPSMDEIQVRVCARPQ